MSAANGFLNGLLVGASGYALYVIKPSVNPYAFTACAIGLCHGLVGLLANLKKDDDDTKKYRDISQSIMDIVPLPLVNIELYRCAEETSVIALGHGLFIIPLALDLISKYFGEEGGEGENNNSETLVHLTILGNVVSLLFLAINEANMLYGLMALVAFLTKYSAIVADNFFEDSYDTINIIGHTLFFYMTALAVLKFSE